MKQLINTLLALCILAITQTVTQAASVKGIGSFEIPKWFKESFLDLRDDIREASAEKKRVMLYFHQNGCPYCAELVNTNFSQKQIVDYMDRNIVAIDMNMWGDREVTDVDGKSYTEKTFAAAKKVWFTPTILFFDEKGNTILRINGYYPPSQFMAALEYVAGRHETGMDFRSFFAQRNPPKSSGSLNSQAFFHSPPYDLRGLGDKKPLLIFFEQKQCPACDNLHQKIVPLPETMKQIRRFDAIQLDMWSDTPVITPEGRNTTASKWAKELGIVYSPSVVCFNEGKDVVRIEAFLKAFHTQSVLDYCASAAYKTQPSMQRFIDARAEKIIEKGQDVDLWKQ